MKRPASSGSTEGGGRSRRSRPSDAAEVEAAGRGRAAGASSRGPGCQPDAGAAADPDRRGSSPSSGGDGTIGGGSARRGSAGGPATVRARPAPRRSAGARGRRQALGPALAAGVIAAGVLAAGLARPARAAGPGLRATLAEAPRAARVLDFDARDADVRDVLRLLAEAGGVSVVMGETVTGRVTVHLEDARWADAMAAVLQSQGLGADLEGTVLFVDTLEQLARASADRRARADATAALAPLVTRLIPVHHARAAELAPLVKASLSPRGSVRVDERTNTLIVTDIAEP